MLFKYQTNRSGPFSGEELEFFMKHRKPMRWIDQIIKIESLESGIAECEVGEGHLALMNGVIYPAAYLEMIAQSYGYLKAALAIDSGFYLSKAYLAAIDEFEMISEKQLKADVKLTIKIEQKYDLDPLFIIEGRVFCNEELIAKAKLKCFASFERINHGNK